MELCPWIDHLIAEQPVPPGITLTAVDAGAREPRVQADPERLRRVLVNVLSNAWQAIQGAGEQPGTVTVTTRSARGRAWIEVTDTGPGISPELLPRIFEPLFSGKPFGVGLGLSIARQIVEQHAGVIEITSLPGQGATVQIALPLDTSKAGA